MRVMRSSAVLLLASLAAQPAAITDTEWPLHGGVDNIRYSPLDQINRENVASLQVAWTYDSQRRLQGLRDAEQPGRRRRRALRRRRRR